MEQLTNIAQVAPLVDEALAAYWKGDLAAARTAAREAQVQARAADHAASLALALAVEAAVEAQAGRLFAAEDRLNELKPLLAGLEQPITASCAAYQVEALVALGRVEAASRLGEAAKAGLTSVAVQGLLDAAMAASLSMTGRHDEGLQLAEQALTAGQTSGVQEVAVRAAIARAEIALRASDCEAAQHAATEGLAAAEAAGYRLSVARLRGILGEAAMGRGEKTAHDHFEAMKDLAEALGATALLAQAHFGMAASGPQPQAYQRVVEAQRLVREVVDGLALESSEAALAVPEFARIMGGNHVAFGRVRVRRSPTGPVGFPPRMMGW